MKRLLFSNTKPAARQVQVIRTVGGNQIAVQTRFLKMDLCFICDGVVWVVILLTETADSVCVCVRACVRACVCVCVWCVYLCVCV